MSMRRIHDPAAPTNTDRRIYRKSGLIRRNPEKDVPRPAAEYLTNEIANTTRINLPHGCFNAGLAAGQDPSKLIMVFRPDEYAFSVCRLYRNDFQLAGPAITLGITNCADPRLIWMPDGRLMVIYSSFDNDPKDPVECMRGAYVFDPAVHETSFISPVVPFRISPPGLPRQKNWMPFLFEGELYLVASVRPHIIYKWEGPDKPATQVHETSWLSPWFLQEFKRGNTNIIQMPDGNYLGTFHTVQLNHQMHYYDNGCYVFEGKPPFRVLRCSRRCYLPAEAAIEPHFRKEGRITVCFPVGMVAEDNKLLISYGDNDSSVKIAETTIERMLSTTLPVY